jgi:2-dehydro-3-deoxyglucarate aldolase/4-hydroxy-2-oxoheptanedioate aldolase
MSLPPNSFKRDMRRADQMLGVWAMSGSPVAAEALGYAGYDFVVLDMEHGPNDVPRTLALLHAMAGTPSEAVVRLPWNDAVTVKQLLDCGALTLMFPYIQDADEARSAVAATRYPPHGVRGFAGMSRATRYGGVPNYAHQASDEICVIVQLETRRAVGNLARIAAEPGVDCIFVGPGDLSADMGHIGRPDHEEVQSVLAAAAAECRRVGIPSGILAANAAQAATYLSYGYNWVAVGSDLGLMMSNARAELRTLRERA